MNARFLEIEITGKCHYHCLHCYGSFPQPGELSRERVMGVIDEARDCFDAIILSGGEPFLHPDLIELTHHAKDFVVFITTAGYAMERKQIQALPGNVVLVFGLDGMGEVHDSYRGKAGAYKQLLHSMELAQDRPKEIIATLWKGVLPQIEEIIELAETHRALLHFNALIPVGRAKNNPAIMLCREEHEAVLKKLNDLRVNREAFLATDLHKVTENDLDGIDLFCKGRYSINPSGDVRPCEFHYRVLGNIFNEPLNRIIERARQTDFIKSREEGFKKQVRLDLRNPFDYHTEICHALASTTL